MKDSLKNKILMTILLLIILIIIVPAGIIFMYNLGRQGCIIINTTVTEGEAFGFYGAFLGFIGTVSLGALALYQNNKMQEDNKKLQQKLLMIEQEREKQKEMDLCVDLLIIARRLSMINIHTRIEIELDEKNKEIFTMVTSLEESLSEIITKLKNHTNKDEQFTNFTNYVSGIYQDVLNIMKECVSDNGINTKIFFEKISEKINVEEFDDKCNKFLISRKEQKNEDTI